MRPGSWRTKWPVAYPATSYKCMTYPMDEKNPLNYSVLNVNKFQSEQISETRRGRFNALPHPAYLGLTTFDFEITLTLALRHGSSVSPSSYYPALPSPPPIVTVTVKS